MAAQTPSVPCRLMCAALSSLITIHICKKTERKEDRLLKRKEQDAIGSEEGITFICHPPSLVSPWLCLNPLPSSVVNMPWELAICRVVSNCGTIEVPRIHHKLGSNFFHPSSHSFISFFTYIPHISFCILPVINRMSCHSIHLSLSVYISYIFHSILSNIILYLYTTCSLYRLPHNVSVLFNNYKDAQ